ncbi:3335_t:CDS:2 [Paraglomus occultum]|uniref:3335_t:CDS:1 n=1 Tax=Paraglomus occultum TaxID=144539 RepID=A0A9N9C907_9GLOM|nr:3335_t:CDS:2 [Paraglomus occultum]
MRSFRAFAVISVAVVSLSLHVKAICKGYGANCPQEAPCCNMGWCSNDPKFCAFGCEPDNSFNDKSCYPDPPCVSLYDDFSNKSLVSWFQWNGDPNSYHWTSDFKPDYASYDNNGDLQLGLQYDGTDKNDQGRYQGFGSTVSSTRAMEFGTVTARIKTGSTASGIVTSFITKNTVGDEIDYEWVGLNPNEVQSNYYWNGSLDYTKGQHHPLGADSTADFHIYTIEWLPDHISWIVDGNLVRTVNKADTLDPATGLYKFPARPSRVQFSMWDGGMGADVNITCYYNGNASTTWPPDGYGPPKVATNSSSGALQTLGTDVPAATPTQGGYQPQIDTGSGVDYSASPLPKLVVPVATVCSLVVVGAIVFGIWKYRKSKGEDYVKYP